LIHTTGLRRYGITYPATPTSNFKDINKVLRMATNRQIQLLGTARSRGTLDTETLTKYIHGSEEIVRQRRAAFKRVEDVLGTSDTSKLPRQYSHTGREDLYREGLEEGRAALNDMIAHQHTFFDDLTPRHRLSNYSPFGLSMLLIKPTLRQMATPEQQQKWLRPTERGEINWAYVQTELGHGTFVRGMETTATFDEAKDCFIINSPTVTSAKYWPGSLAFSTTDAVVMARLVVKGQDHGVHAFVVQIRNMDGTPTAGVELGDIGVMSSYNQNDNGYARFDHVPIPRENMLMARATVSRDGTYYRPKHSKASYTTMLYG
jgi:acyl-CoA oxidase